MSTLQMETLSPRKGKNSLRSHKPGGAGALPLPAWSAHTATPVPTQQMHARSSCSPALRGTQSAVTPPGTPHLLCSPPLPDPALASFLPAPLPTWGTGWRPPRWHHPHLLSLTALPPPPGLHLHAGSRWGRIPNVLARSQGLAAQLGSWPGNLYQSPSFLSVQRRPAKSWAVFLPAPPCPVRYLPILCPLLPSTSQPL